MQLNKSQLALAASALFASVPFAAHAVTVSFNQPSANATVSGVLQGSSCEVRGSGIARVRFYFDSTLMSTDSASPWQCSIDTTKFPDGRHRIRAVAYDSAGTSNDTSVYFYVQNGTSGGTTNTPPTLSLSAPASGATVSGTVSCAASASDSDGIKQVAFSLDGAPLSTDTSSPYACSFDSTQLSNATHKLTAVATDGLGATTTREVSFTVNNGTASNPGPTLAWTAPANGATLKGQATCATSATDSNGVAQVQYFLNDKLFRTEKTAPYTCEFWTPNFPDGAYVLKAVATDTKGATSSAQLNVTIANSTTANTPPTVSLTAPASSATLSGTSAGYAATASDTGGSVAKVDFLLVNGASQTPIATKTASPYSGTFDTTKVANGSYALMAVATDNLGATATTQRSVTISNTSTTPNPTPSPAPGGGTTLPSTNAKAIPTFESLGMYWKPGTTPGADGCSVRYKKAGDTSWKQGLPMWYDARNAECRGSIVHLEPGTDYAVEMGIGTSFKAGVNTKTWSENFPIAKTVKVQSGSNTLAITEGGTKDGYVLYEGPATIDVANAKDFNVTIAAPYVIVRGLTLKGAKRDGVHLLAGAHDVVIEDNDISGWGRLRTTLSNGWQVGVDRDSAVGSNCRTSGYMIERTIIQRNKLHDPRYTTNSWDFGHPAGPQAITYMHCGGNHVFRYNEIFSADGKKYMNDAIGGGDNFSDIGFPNADTDIYGNRISHTWDDAIEAEGGNRNVRIWGNYLDQTAIGIATTVTHFGPVYVFRNVYNRSRMKSQKALDSDDRSHFGKSGTQSGFGGGRRYVLHNTLLQATQSGVTNPLGAGGGIIAAGTSSPVTNTVSRNNILHIWKTHWDSIRTQGGGGNDFDYDLRNGGIAAYAGAEPNGIVGTPVYKSGHGWSNWAGGNYQLDRSSPGYDKGVRLPNFNDGFTGNAPDMGAHEADTPAMKLGIGAASSVWAAPSTTTTTTTVSSGTTSTSGVCSTITCASQ